ncbi:MAG: UDPglucose--hexose-phosphate uridylyltransferase [Actinomycetota bacterium]|nr:UDPglucose--hexose-phosphate uridylyltransferase [Actinomycetota bacterium]
MKRTFASLADGREIVYYDESDHAEHVLVDPRDLPETTTRSEIRYDAALDEWVAMASHRQGRTHLPPSDECPLCPSTETRHTEIPSPSYDVVVFENRFPSFATSVADVTPLSTDAGPDLLVRQPGHGRCEVVCFTSDHSSSFSQLSPARVRTVIEAWVDRTIALAALPHVEQVFCFENRGEEIGVTLAHPHGQIYGYPFVTPRSRQMLDSARRYRERTWRNLFADLLAAEQADGSRIVTRSELWTAFVPAAARWPMEVHLYPNRHVADLPGLTDEERDDFAEIYLDVLRRFDALYESPMPYIAGWHQAPVRIDRDLAYLHLELFSVRRAAGKLKYLAGSESGMGAFINDVLPEQAAAMLREVRPPFELGRR